MTVAHGDPALLIVEDHELVRLGVRTLLRNLPESPQFELLEATTLGRGIELYRERVGDIQLVLLDLNLPDSKGLRALRTFRQYFPAARIVVLTGAADESISAEAKMMGAADYLNKGSDLSRIKYLVRSLEGTQHVPKPVEPTPLELRRATLTTREVEILDLVLQGYTNQEIAAATDLKLGTVKNYLSGLMIVFGVTSRHKLINLFA